MFSPSLLLCSSAQNSSQQNSSQHPSSSSKSQTTQQRSVPPPPTNFYQEIQRNSKPGAKVPASGIPAPRYLGGDPSLLGNDEKIKKRKANEKEPQISNYSKLPTTVQDAMKYLVGPTAPLINRQAVDSEEKLIEKAFMEGTADKIEEVVDQKCTDSHEKSRTNFSEFVRNPIPWIKEQFGYGNEEESFNDLLYFNKPHPTVEKEWAHPAMYHGEQTLDAQRMVRIGHLASGQAYAAISGKVVNAPLHMTMNSASNSSSAKTLRRVANETILEVEQNSPQQQKIPHWSHRLRHAWGWGVQSLLCLPGEANDKKTANEKQLLSVMGLTSAVLCASFLTALAQRYFDFIGDSTPPATDTFL